MTALAAAVTVLAFTTFVLGVAVWWLYHHIVVLEERVSALEAGAGLALLPPGPEASLTEELEAAVNQQSLTQWDPPSRPARKTTTGDEY